MRLVLVAEMSLVQVAYTTFTWHNFSVPARYGTVWYGTVRLKFDM